MIYVEIIAIIVLLAYAGGIHLLSSQHPGAQPDAKRPANFALLAAGLLLMVALAGCATTATRPPAPIVETKEVLVPTPVPCKALIALGDEPVYPDTDEALATAPDIFEQTKLLLKGRILRGQRLMRYGAVRVACVF